MKILALALIIIGCVYCAGCIGCARGVRDCGEKEFCVNGEDDARDKIRAEGAIDESSLLLPPRTEFWKKEICADDGVWLNPSKTEEIFENNSE